MNLATCKVKLTSHQSYSSNKMALLGGNTRKRGTPRHIQPEDVLIVGVQRAIVVGVRHAGAVSCRIIGIGSCLRRSDRRDLLRGRSRCNWRGGVARQFRYLFRRFRQFSGVRLWGDPDHLPRIEEQIWLVLSDSPTTHLGKLYVAIYNENYIGA